MSKRNYNLRKNSDSLDLETNQLALEKENRENKLSESKKISNKGEMILYKNLQNIDLTTYDYLFLGREINKIRIQDFNSFILLLNNIKKKFIPSILKNNINFEKIKKDGKFSFKNNNLTDLMLIEKNKKNIEISINSRYIKTNGLVKEKYNLYGTKSFFKGKHCFEIEFLNMHKLELFIGIINISYFNLFKLCIRKEIIQNFLYRKNSSWFNIFNIKQPFFIQCKNKIYNHYIVISDILGLGFDLEQKIFYLFLNGEIINTEVLTVDTGPNYSFVPIISIGRNTEIIFNSGSDLKYEKIYKNYGLVPLDEYEQNRIEISQLKKVTDDYINILKNHGKFIIKNKNISYSDINQIFHIIFDFFGKYSFKETYIISKSVIKEFFEEASKKYYTNNDFKSYYIFLLYILNSSSKKKTIIKNILLNIAENIHIYLKKGYLENIIPLQNLFNFFIFLINRTEIQDFFYSSKKILTKAFKSIFVSFQINTEVFKENNFEFIINFRNDKKSENISSFPNLIMSNKYFHKEIILTQIKLKDNFQIINDLFIKLLKSIYLNGTEGKKNIIYNIFTKFIEKEINNMSYKNIEGFCDLFKNIFIPSMISFNNEYQKEEKMTFSIKNYLIKLEVERERIGGSFQKVHSQFAKEIPNFDELLNYRITNFNNIYFLHFISLFSINMNFYTFWEILKNIIEKLKENINIFFLNKYNETSIDKINENLLEYIKYKLYYINMNELKIFIEFLYNISDFIHKELYPKKLIYFLPEYLIYHMKYVIDFLMNISEICQLSFSSKINYINDLEIKKFIEESFLFNKNLKKICDKCFYEYLNIFIKLIEDKNIKKTELKCKCVNYIKKYFYLEQFFTNKDLYSILNFITLIHNKPKYKNYAFDFIEIFEENINLKESIYYKFGKRLSGVLEKNTNLLRALLILLYDSIDKNLSKLEEKFGELQLIPKIPQNTQNIIYSNNNSLFIDHTEIENLNIDITFNNYLEGRTIFSMNTIDDDIAKKLIILIRSFKDTKYEFLKLNNFYRLTSKIKELYEINSFEYKKLCNLLLSLNNLLFSPINIAKIEDAENDDDDGLNILYYYANLLKKIKDFYNIIINNIIEKNDKKTFIDISKQRNIFHLKDILKVFEKFIPPIEENDYKKMKTFIEKLEQLVPEEETIKQEDFERQNDNINNLCPICSDSIIDTHLLSCEHAICRNCLYQQIFENNVCPFCRVKIKGIKEDPNFKI